MLTLLAEDVATIPADLLEQAIQRHVASSPYMPKAADLTKLARDVQSGRSINVPRGGPSYAHDLAAARNAQLARDDIEWIVDSNGALRLTDKPSFTARHTIELDRKAERERAVWMANQSHPSHKAQAVHP